MEPSTTKRRNRIYLWLFLTIGWTIQGITYFWVGESPLSLISGLFGICSVVLCTQGDIKTFFFGFGQIGTYLFLCWQQRLYGEIAINTFYFFSQFYGIYLWRKRAILAQRQILPTRSLTLRTAIILLIGTIVATLLVGYGLSLTDDTQPYLDAFTTVSALVAQMLMILAYREHWYVWLMIDALYVVLWVRVGDWCMVMQYSFWCLNAIYGLVHWTRSQR